MKRGAMFLYGPIFLLIASNVCYHIVTKSMPQSINPLAALAITYVVGCAFSLLLYFLISPVKNLAVEYQQLNWVPWTLGLVIVGLEMGSISMYAAGWNISVGSLIANIGVALILILVGLLFYKETITLKQALGMVFCLVGLILINK